VHLKHLVCHPFAYLCTSPPPAHCQSYTPNYELNWQMCAFVWFVVADLTWIVTNIYKFLVIIQSTHNTKKCCVWTEYLRALFFDSLETPTRMYQVKISSYYLFPVFHVSTHLVLFYCRIEHVSRFVYVHLSIATFRYILSKDSVLFSHDHFFLHLSIITLDGMTEENQDVWSE
jgi:hypothetical protein